jgi:hypothetical protein
MSICRPGDRAAALTALRDALTFGVLAGQQERLLFFAQQVETSMSRHRRGFIL